MTKTKINADADITGSQRKRNTTHRTNVTPQNNTTSNTNNQSSQPQAQPQNRKNKQNQSQTQSQNQSQTQSQASTKPSSPAPPLKTATPPPTKVEKHVPLDGFNANEIDELLNAGSGPTALVYKPEQPATQKSSPWGQKSGTMATGKDFWNELRKQVASLQKGESINKGG